MASLAADMSFDFTFPSCEPATPPSFSFDSSLLEIPYHPAHARSSSYGTVYPTIETSPADTVSTRRTTPSNSPAPIRQHGPILLPRIRSQDQEISNSPPKRIKTEPTRAAAKAMRSASGIYRASHSRSFTNPESLSQFAGSFFTAPVEDQSQMSQSLMCSPVIFPQDNSMQARRCSLDGSALEKYGFPTYRQMPSYVPGVTQAAQMAQIPSQMSMSSQMSTQMPSQVESFMYSTQYTHRAPSPLSIASTPEPIPSTTLMSYLTSSNPAPSLVRTISYPLRDPSTKHFWWDVRQIRPWSTFNSSTILSLPGASALLNCPVPASLLPQPAASARHPETEAALHNIYASYYLPKLNSALALSSQRPLQLSTVSNTRASSPASSASGAGESLLFTANVAGEPASAAALFGGKPTARVVGLVKSFDRFNTGMRVEGNIKRVEYLRGLAHLHHAMREHGCRYGFILTEIELVVVRNGAEATPHFGYLEVSSVQLAATAASHSNNHHHHVAVVDENGDLLHESSSLYAQEKQAAQAAKPAPLTACLALWGLCMLASADDPSSLATSMGEGEHKPQQAHAHWRAEIGAPAEGTRRKALPRDDWMPKPQLAEKREAKRARGWVFPEDPVGRKELGKRGVRYGAC